jgi:oligosaccharide reducing-end xylanase
MGLACACGGTTDPVGYNLVPLAEPLHDLNCPSSYPPNAYTAVLGKTAAEITEKLESGFAQLFGDETVLQSIYFPDEATDSYYIYDTLHKDVRTEGMGLGMLVAVSLGKQTEFDALWRYSKAKLQLTAGAAAGYFRSRCDISDTVARDCVDPYGLEQFTMALLLARARWGADLTGVDYRVDARSLLALMRTKVIANGGIVDGVTNTFDSDTKLAYDEPVNDGQPFLQTALAIPAYYDLWAQVTGDPFYTDAARAARGFLSVAAHAETGLYPKAANFDGSPRDGLAGHFTAEAFRVHVNMALDEHWGTPAAEQVAIINRMLAFFKSKGLSAYGSSYTLDGDTVLKKDHSAEVVMVNGVIASISTIAAADRTAYIQAAWNLTPPIAESRYYSGLMYLAGNLLLSGRLRVCP